MSNFAIVGASGLIGSCLVDELLQTTTSKITLITRRPLGLHSSRIHELIVDFSNQAALNEAVKGIDAVFIAIGTTQKKMKGDLSAYRKIDYEIPMAIAQSCATNNIPKLLLVSSIGANSSSSNFYLRLKGEVEDAIERMAIPYVGIFQPSLLLGNRKEFRLGERISQFLMPLFSFVIPPMYKPIAAKSVAKAMIREAISTQVGVKRYTYTGMVH
ncbi:MAG: NAD(P)H-binding protein [Bacteroidota bacterium]